MENPFLIVGLGNPGRRYERTRHNAGFMAVQELARRHEADWATEARFQARLARMGREPVLFCLPETFMNESGVAVAAVTRFYRVGLERLLVVVDDADLELGALRLRPQGSSGGHHGLESIEQHLGTREFARLRVGIGRNDASQREITGYVLSTFRADEQTLLEKVLDRACEQILCWWRDGTAAAMNRFNGVVKI